jgi:hypothetical protein
MFSLVRPKLIGTLVLGGLIVAGGIGAAGTAQAEELNDKTVNWLMKAAFGMLPDKFTTAEQKVINIDHSKPDDYLIPIEDAREVVKIAYNSARAQTCHLMDKQRDNYQALVKHQTDANKWNDKQLLYIKQLHLFVVQFGTGSIKITQQGDDQKVETIPNEKLSTVKPCSDDEKKALLEKIDTYVKS